MLPDTPHVDHACVWCGYPLKLLPENRCPECGQAFDPSQPDVPPVPPVKVGSLGAVKLLLKGVPFRSSPSVGEWLGFRTPFFPIGFVAIAALCSIVVHSLGVLYIFPGRHGRWLDYSGMLPLHFLTKSATICIFVALHLVVVQLTLRWCGAREKLIQQGATRVIYFATSIQPLLEIPWAILGNYSSVEMWGQTLRSAALWMFTVAVMFKVAVLLAALMREPRMTLFRALLAVGLCPDVILCVLVRL